MTSMKFIVFFVGLTTIAHALPIDDQCNVIARFTTTGQILPVTFRHECHKGEIQWDYPRGTFRINFDPPNAESFRLCLKADRANYIKEIYSVVGSRKDRIQAPTEGHDACVSSHEGAVHLELVAPTTQFFATLIPFTVSLT